MLVFTWWGCFAVVGRFETDEARRAHIDTAHANEKRPVRAHRLSRRKLVYVQIDSAAVRATECFCGRGPMSNRANHTFHCRYGYVTVRAYAHVLAIKFLKAATYKCILLLCTLSFSCVDDPSNKRSI